MASETIDLAQLPSWLDAQARALEGISFTPLIKVVKQLLQSDYRSHFDTGTDVDGIPWAPFKRTPSKKRGGPGAKMLWDRGILAASGAAGGTNNISLETPTSLEWGTAVEYAGYHNFGTRWIPKRSFIGIGPSLSQKLDRACLDFALGLIGGRRP